jgi:hypothetical protein
VTEAEGDGLPSGGPDVVFNICTHWRQFLGGANHVLELCQEIAQPLLRQRWVASCLLHGSVPPSPPPQLGSDSRDDGLLLAAHDAVGETVDVETVAKDCSGAVPTRQFTAGSTNSLWLHKKVDPDNGELDCHILAYPFETDFFISLCCAGRLLYKRCCGSLGWRCGWTWTTGSLSLISPPG